MRPRVAVVHQGFIPPYRKRFFELLGTRQEVEYVVFHGDPPRRSGHRSAEGPFGFSNVQVRNRELSVAGRTVLYQPIVRQIANGSFAGAVLGAELKLVANVALWTVLRHQGKAVILWGQGREKHEDRGNAGSAVARLAAGVKLYGARHADGYLAYTDSGAERVIEHGVDPERVAVVRNTIDVESEIALHEQAMNAEESELRAERGLQPASLVLLYTGRLYSEKRTPELIMAMRALRERGFGPDAVELVVLGDGPDLARVTAMAAGLPGVHLAGAVYDPAEVAAYMRIASALVIPGKVGLAVNHAFAHGLPVLTRASGLHAPEIEYVTHDRNGMIVEGDERAYVAVLADFASDPVLRERLAAGALEARADLTLEGMVRRFDEGVRRALRRNSSARGEPPRVNDARP